MKAFSASGRLVDHALSLVSTLLVLYSVGISIAQPALSLFFCASVFVGSLVGLAMAATVRQTRWGALDAWLYALVALAAVFASPSLNELLPGEGFDRRILVANTLAWMVVFGSFFTWRDQTLIFQAVPCIALFGLVGAFDTYKGATLLFFIFLLSIATLFARMHRRAMVRQAEAALGGLEEARVRILHTGPFHDPVSPNTGEEPVQERLAQGPWRWMAGPEWAFASAAGVVLLALIGAPLLRQSAQPISQAVELETPIRAVRRDILNPSNVRYAEAQGDFAIGAGPIDELSEEPVLEVAMDRRRYLRGNVYTRYLGNSWSMAGNYVGLGEGPDFRRVAGLPPMSVRRIGFRYRVLSGVHHMIYLPGEFNAMGQPARVRLNLDGTVSTPEPLRAGDIVQGFAFVPPDDVELTTASSPPAPTARNQREFFEVGNRSERLQRFVEEAVAGAETDFEKAVRLKEAIERQVRYNLLAPRIPRGRDAIDVFLFETREGYCDLFASAMAVTARMAGLPSRVATGFYPNGEMTRDGTFVVRSADYHAWAEIYFDGVGWVPFDPTEGAPAVAGAGRGATTEQARPWHQKEWFRGVLRGLLAAVGLAILFVAARIVWLLVSGRERRKPDPIARAYGRFLRTLERKAKRPRRLSQTTGEYVDGLAHAWGSGGERVRELSRKFDEALYSPRSLTDEEARELLRAVRSLASELGKEARPRP